VKRNTFLPGMLLAMTAVIVILVMLAACSSSYAPAPSVSPSGTVNPAPSQTSSPPATGQAPSPTASGTAPAQFTINTATKANIGGYLVDGKGMTLYYFAKDTIGKSNAAGAILANWPVFNAGNIAVPPALNAADFGSITRDDGSKQTTYKGWPLYHYIKDQVSGDTLGQGAGGVWFVINPANFPPTPTSSATPSPTPTPTPPPPPTTSPTPAAPAPVAINIKGFAFTPSSVTVKVGTTVTWTNQDGTDHTVSSDTSVFSWRLDANGGTFSYTFNQVGTFPYHCAIHPSMTGKIIVQ
jgi:predicted lipoprotein with Yx(FWY)xxD motif/plastocyanin